MSSTLGTLFRITSFGESHGPCEGVVIDGCPAGLRLDVAELQRDLARRSAAGQPGATPRREPDEVRILAGLRDGVTTGAPICLMVENTNTDATAYTDFMRTPRPGHADYPARIKYGNYGDPRGGGRFSGRITAGFVMAGAVARVILHNIGTEVDAHTVAIGGVLAPPCAPELIRERRSATLVSCCDEPSGVRMVEVIEAARKRGDSVGGVIECVARGLPPGIGEPVFASVESEIARAAFSIPAVKGVEFGDGFALTGMKGSEANDAFAVRDGQVVTLTNHSGGVLGGLTNGMPLVLRVAIKPTPSIAIRQRTVDVDKGTDTELAVSGRHDACIVPRAVVVVEAMVAAALCDLVLQSGLIPRVMTCP